VISKNEISRTEYWIVLCEGIPNDHNVIVRHRRFSKYLRSFRLQNYRCLTEIVHLAVTTGMSFDDTGPNVIFDVGPTECRGRSAGWSASYMTVSIAATRFRHVATRCCYSSLYRLRRVRNLRNASFSINPLVERGSVQRDRQRRRIGD